MTAGPAAYRAAPVERPVVRLREVTAPLGAGRALALLLLAAGVANAAVPQLESLECARVADGGRCRLTVHRGLFDSRRAVDTRGLVEVARSSAPALPLRRAVERFEHQRPPRRLALPARGIYRDPAGVWWDDGRLPEAARELLTDRRARRGFVALQAHGLPADVSFATGLLAPLAGLALLLWSERRTRVLRLTLDPNARSAHARSAGLGGPELDRRCSLGADARLQRLDATGAPHLSLVRVVGADGASLPLLTGHAPEHRASLDRLVARANRALGEGTAGDRSPSLAARFAPTALLALALALLAGRVVSQRTSHPPVTGTVVLTSSVDRCDSEGLTLLRGARVEWGAPVGVATRVFTVRMPDGATRSTAVTLEVAPGRRTRFDCAWLRGASALLRASPDREGAGD